jgi:hypothetical protein
MSTKRLVFMSMLLRDVPYPKLVLAGHGYYRKTKVELLMMGDKHKYTLEDLPGIQAMRIELFTMRMEHPVWLSTTGSRRTPA